MESPCQKICALDENQVCLGCGRTIDEITEWHLMSDSQRRTIMARLRDELIQIEAR
jgi:uncharacterized protein